MSEQEKQLEKSKIELNLEYMLQKMKHKLFLKVDNGAKGWDEQNISEIKETLKKHIEKDINGEQAVDIANIAFFLWYKHDFEQNGTNKKVKGN